MSSVRHWPGRNSIQSHSFKCGWCQNQVASSYGWVCCIEGQNVVVGIICICPHCDFPTFFKFESGKATEQTPGIASGNSVLHVPQNLNTLYEEARKACSMSGFTSAVMLCRKILMHIAVDKDSTLLGKSFKECVDYLERAGYVPPGGKKWVDKIRTKGNEANHEIVIMTDTDAKDLIGFCEMLLKFIYEFPAKV